MAVACVGASSCSRTSQPLTARMYRLGPRDTAEVARGTVQGRVGVLVYVDRVRNHPLAKIPLTYEGVSALLDATGIDAVSEVDRAFITAPSAEARAKVVVLEHSVPEARVRAGLSKLASRGQGPVPGLGFDAVTVTLDGERRLVAQPEPGLLVMLTGEQLDDAVRGFVGTGGFPDPVGDEVAVFFAFDPHRTLEGLPFPRTIGAAQASMTVDKAGGAALRFQARSTTPAQAQLDAASMTKMVDEVLTVDLLSFKLRVIPGVAFRAEGSEVRADVRFRPDEIQWLVAFSLGGS